LLGALAVLAFAAPASAAQPNVLFIVTDDQRLDGTAAVMPKTMKWFRTGDAAQGIAGGTYFPEGVATTPFCCPARASIFTGRYAHNHGVQVNETSSPNCTPAPGVPPTGAAALDQNTTLQRYLRNAGYRTGIFGKFLNGWCLSDNPPHWDEWTIWGGGPFSGLEVAEDPGVRKWLWRYSTGYLADRAEDFLQRSNDNNDGQPWYLYIAPKAPHGPYDPEPKYANDPVPALDEGHPSYFEQDRSDKAPWIQTRHNDADTVKEEWTPYWQSLKSVDDLVERVMTKLRTLNEDQDTIAVFISDNGFMWGEHGLVGKTYPFLDSIRVPFYLRWPNAPDWPGSGTNPGHPGTDNRLVGNVDLAPTVVDAVNDAVAGDTDIAPSPAMDGISLVDPNQRERNAILTEEWGWGAQPPPQTRGYCYGTQLTWASIVTHRFQYVEHYQTHPENPNQGGCPAIDANGNPVRHVTHYDSVVFRDYYDITPGPNGDEGQLENILADDNVSPTGQPDQFFQLQDDANKENDPPTATLGAKLQQLRECQGAACIPLPSDPADLPIDVAITSAPSDPTDDRNPSFKFTSTEPTATYRCRYAVHYLTLSSAPWEACTSPKTYLNQPEFRHGFSVQAVSPSGATDTQDYFWTQENVAPPETTITSRPRRSSVSGSATFHFKGSAADNTFTCQLDALPSTPCTSPITYAVGNGEHMFTVKAIDSSAVEDPTPAIFKWRVDLLAPDSAIARSATFATNSTGATFTFTPSWVTGDRPVTGRIECRLDGANFRPCGASKTFARLPEGQRTVNARFADVAGNVDTTAATDTWNLGPTQLFSTAADPSWPQIADATGEVRAIVPDGSGGWYVAGDFTSLRDAVNLDHPHTDLVHIRGDKSVDDNWRPATNGAVRTIVLSGSTMYIGGTFTQVSGTSAGTANMPRNRLAAISTVTGDPTGWNPGADGEVNALVIPPPRFGGDVVNSIYVAGGFHNAGGAARGKVAEIGLSGVGTATGWNPNVSTGPILQAMAVTQTYVYIGASAPMAIGGPPTSNPVVNRAHLAELERSTGRATAWAPEPDGSVHSLRLKLGLGGLPTLYAGGQFGNIGSPSKPRRRAAEINLADSGSVTDWDPAVSASGTAVGNVRDIMPTTCAGVDPSCAAILGGAFVTAKTGPGQVGRSRIAQTDSVTGDPHDWNPNLSATPYSFSCWPSRCDINTNRVLAVGGIFTTVGGVARNRLAFFPKP
jgi:arylsulfatase A-like enzyme